MQRNDTKYLNLYILTKWHFLALTMSLRNVLVELLETSQRLASAKD
jgi:hypothetical protein